MCFPNYNVDRSFDCRDVLVGLVPKPWAVTAAFVVTFALFVALTAVAKPTVTGLLTVQGAP